MWKFAAVILMGLLPCQAQVLVSLSPWQTKAVQRSLGQRAAKTVLIWTVALENESPTDPVAVSESAVIRRIPQLQPYSVSGVEELIGDAEKNSIWPRLARGGEDVLAIAVYLHTAGTVKLGQSIATGLAGGIALAPHFIDRIQSAGVPSQANFDKLAWRQPISLQPGESATAYIFTATSDKPQPVSVFLDTSKVHNIKLIR